MSSRLTIFVTLLFLALVMLGGYAFLAHLGHHIKAHESQRQTAAANIVQNLVDSGSLSLDIDGEEADELRWSIADVANTSVGVSHLVANYCGLATLISIFGASVCITSLLLGGGRSIRRKSIESTSQVTQVDHVA